MMEELDAKISEVEAAMNAFEAARDKWISAVVKAFSFGVDAQAIDAILGRMAPQPPVDAPLPKASEADAKPITPEATGFAPRNADVVCPNCAAVFVVADEPVAGRLVRCPACDRMVTAHVQEVSR